MMEKKELKVILLTWESKRQGETGGKGKRKIKELVIEGSQQRQIAKKTEVKRYEQRISEFKQNQLFQVNQKQVNKELNGEK